MMILAQRGVCKCGWNHYYRDWDQGNINVCGTDQAWRKHGRRLFQFQFAVTRKGLLRFEFAGAHWWNYSDDEYSRRGWRRGHGHLQSLNEVYCKKITTLPEEVKIVNKVYVVCVACRLEPDVQT